MVHCHNATLNNNLDVNPTNYVENGIHGWLTSTDLTNGILQGHFLKFTSKPNLNTSVSCLLTSAVLETQNSRQNFPSAHQSVSTPFLFVSQTNVTKQTMFKWWFYPCAVIVGDSWVFGFNGLDCLFYANRSGLFIDFGVMPWPWAACFQGYLYFYFFSLIVNADILKWSHISWTWKKRVSRKVLLPTVTRFHLLLGEGFTFF